MDSASVWQVVYLPIITVLQIVSPPVNSNDADNNDVTVKSTNQERAEIKRFSNSFKCLHEMVFFDVIYQTRETVFHPISKHEKRVENASSGVFLTKFEGLPRDIY